MRAEGEEGRRGARGEVARLAFCGKGKSGGARCVVVAREAGRGRTRGREGEWGVYTVGCGLLAVGVAITVPALWQSVSTSAFSADTLAATEVTCRQYAVSVSRQEVL